MIGIASYSDDICRFLPSLGLTRHAVSLNPKTTDGLSCLVQVGGYDVRSGHCYVHVEGDLPIIQCLDPATINAEPINKVWVMCALAKARDIDLNGYRPPELDIKIRPTLQDVLDYACHCAAAPMLSVDIECDMDTHEITCFGFAYRQGDIFRAISIPLASELLPYWTAEEEAIIWQTVASLLSSSQAKVFQNFIFDTMMMSYYGIHTNGVLYDTLIAAHWIQPELPKGLADLGRLYLTTQAWKKREDYTSNESLWIYNAKDAAYTLAILHNQMEKLKYEKRLEFFTDHLSILTTEVLRLCERGWNLDPQALKAMRDELTPQIDTLLQNLRTFTLDLIRPKITYVHRRGKPKAGAKYYLSESLLGKGQRPSALASVPDGTKRLSALTGFIYEEIVEQREFNPGSPYHVKDVLQALGIKVPIKDGRETTDEVHLLKLMENPRIPAEVKDKFLGPLLDWRGKSKLVSTYCDVEHDADGKVRFQIVISGAKKDDGGTGGTVTSRFSSKQTPLGTGFNSQNVPKIFRSIVVPHNPGWQIINMDFRAADPHMVAWLSGEQTMLEILSNPKGDLHCHTASAIFGRKITKGDLRERQLGKNCNNGLNYGMQPAKFVETCRKQGLSITLDEAKRAFTAYFKLYPGISRWQEDTKQQIIRTRTLETPHGRRRYFYGHMNEKLFNDALAYIPPTTVSDALNIGWLRFAKEIQAEGLGAQMLQQCHDSIMLQAPANEVDKTCELLLHCYKGVTFNVGQQLCNFPTTIETGPNWGKLQEWPIIRQN